MRGLAKPIFTEAYRLKNERLRNGRLWREVDIEVYPKAYQLCATDRPLSRRMMYASWSLQNCFASNTNHPSTDQFVSCGELMKQSARVHKRPPAAGDSPTGTA